MFGAANEIIDQILVELCLFNFFFFMSHGRYQGQIPVSSKAKLVTGPETVAANSNLDVNSSGHSSRQGLDNASTSDESSQWSNCGYWCSCICHKRSQLRPFFNSILGALYISFSNQLISRVTCSEHRCRECAKISSVKITYFFPRWLLARMVSFVGRASAWTCPEFIIRVPRLVPGNAEIFQYAEVGDITGIKRLLKGHAASVDDVAITTGRTALHVSYFPVEMPKEACSDVPTSTPSTLSFIIIAIFVNSCYNRERRRTRRTKTISE
jgi:hypothetical protein